MPNEEDRPIEDDQPEVAEDEGLGFPSNYFKVFGFERVKKLQEEGSVSKDKDQNKYKDQWQKHFHDQIKLGNRFRALMFKKMVESLNNSEVKEK